MNCTTTNITKIHRFYNIGPTDVFPKQQSTFEISEGIWDLSSVKLFFDVDSVGTLPQGIESLIDQLSVSIDGVEIQTIKNYNQLARIVSVQGIAFVQYLRE